MLNQLLNLKLRMTRTRRLNLVIKKTSSLSSMLGAGYMLNDMLGVEAFINYDSANFKDKEFAGSEDSNSQFTETNISLGGKFFVQQALGEKISVNAGVGAGIALKSAKQKLSKTIDNNDKAESIELSSGNIAQPFGLVSAGVDYTVSDGVTIGVEYAVKLNSTKEYKTKKEIM